MCVTIDLGMASEVWAEGLSVTSSGRTLRASVGFYRSFLFAGPERETPGDGGLVSLVLAWRGRSLAPSLQPGLGMEHEQDSTFMVVGNWDFKSCLLRGWLVQVAYFISFSFHIVYRRHSYSYSPLGKLILQRLNSKVTQLWRGKTEIWIQFWLILWLELLNISLSSFSYVIEYICYSPYG